MTDKKKTNLVDSSGRRIKKLRLNLLDACNMRCMYCMPEDQQFSSAKNRLSPQEMTKICTNLVKFGVEEVRLTGGEPLLRSDFHEIVTELSKLNLKKLGLTTNAILLKQHLAFLKTTKLNNINISLDSLNQASFAFITKRDVLKPVLESILMAKEMGFHVKLNCVLLKNINFEEMEQFLEFSATHDIEIRFLELMKVGQALNFHDRHFVSADEAMDRIQRTWQLNKISVAKDSTSFNFIASKNGLHAKIGFIASETKPFCGDCSRLRLSNQGELRPCLMVSEGPSIKDLAISEYEMVLQELIEKKPLGRLELTELTMNEIGG